MYNNLVLLITMLVLATAIGGYIIASIILLKYPSILHQKKKTKIRARHISHAGGAGERLENTLEAFNHAMQEGTEMLELDCHITNDGQVVVSHDNHLIRTTGEGLNISDTDYKHLPQLRSNLHPMWAADHVTHGEDRSIPLLKDVFEAFPDVPINIDIKIDDDELIAKVAQLVEAYKRESITVWGAKSDQTSLKCFTSNPSIPLFFSLKKVVWLVLLYYSGLLPFIPLKESFCEIPMPRVALRGGQSLSAKRRLVINVVDSLLLSRTLFKHLHDRGIQVFLWVLNEEEDFERAFQLGATGVMTDFPTKLTSFLAEHPEYRTHRLG